MTRPDLIVIGGGPGGIGAVDAALRQNRSVVWVTDGPIGGDCTFTGCVPSKALISAAARGVSAADAFAHARHAVQTIAGTEDIDSFRFRGVTVIEGRASFCDPSTISVAGQRHTARRIIVATGATPYLPPIDGLDTAAPLTSDTLWDLAQPPRSVAVLGGGAIGAELAQAIARVGIAVTVIEAEPRILRREEPETSAVLTAMLRANGVDVRVGTPVTRVERNADGEVVVHVEAGTPVVAEQVLVAVGRRAMVAGLDLAAAGIAVDEHGAIVTDDFMQTSVAGVYAVGDVTARFPFTHGAYAQALVAVGHAFGRGRRRRFSTRALPYVTFTDPEIARVGMTEAEAFAQWGAKARVVEVAMSAVDRAVAEGRTEGHIKLIARPGRVLGHRAGGQLVGATIVAPHAGELVHELSLAMKLRLPPAVLALATHAYPTWGMAVQQAASAFFGVAAGGTARPARPSAS